MSIQIVRDVDDALKSKVRSGLIAFNHKHFPERLSGNYEEVHFFLKDSQGEVRGGILCEICWNWLEVHILYVDESLRHGGYGTRLLQQAEQVAKEKGCDFSKLDTLSFQALDFYKKHGYEVFGQIENAGGHTHYYLTKQLKSTTAGGAK
ncbi:GNAT family N-acetyltransferase [Paenibacillus sp. GCM10027626]|uniref:GNAT family N-acetyltransferase n=1 Tax=Paenibacillus sp. GCM10027626 TaxID=3273411 RepID=UPI003633F341